MKVKSSRGAKNVVACVLAVDMFVMKFFLPPFRLEEEYAIDINETMEYDNTRKLVKKNNTRSYDTTSRRNARDSLGKSNYYAKPKDF